MAMGKYTRIDVRKSSNCCSKATVVLIVIVCLVGAWMMMSFSVEVFSDETKDEVTQKVTEDDTQRFDDSPGELPKDALKEDGNQDDFQEGSNSNVHGSRNMPLEESEMSDGSSEEKGLEKLSDKNEDTESGEKTILGAEKDNNFEGVEKESNYGNKDENSDTGGSINGEDQANISDQNEAADISDESKLKASEAEEISGTEESLDGRKQEMEAETKADEKTEQNQVNNSEESSGEINSHYQENEKKLVIEENVDEMKQQDTVDSQMERKFHLDQTKDSEDNPGKERPEIKVEDKVKMSNEALTLDGQQSSQSAESKVNESQKDLWSEEQNDYRWKLCNVTAGPDYIPCLDNIQSIRRLPSTKHYEHRERHCPDESPTCLVPLPEGYRSPLKWPKSREKIWFSNVPHTRLAEYKGHQNWVKIMGQYLTFPGGGTQFKFGALHYIDFIQKTLPEISWGKRSRVILDVGCGVASFGGFLFDRDVLAFSLAPKDEHEAQVQFALERGIPAISAVMGTKRLLFPSMAFDIVHCARCRVPWHVEGGKLLLELNRVLRPGGYFVWSATPVYQRLSEDVGIWKAMSKLTKSMCWELVKIGKDKLNGVAVAIYRKPTSNDCYERRPHNVPPLCKESDDPNAAWNVTLQACIHRVPEDASDRGSKWPAYWPLRLEKPPYWLKSSEVGVHGKSAPKVFNDDLEHWKHVANSYMNDMGINWSSVRNIMDMRALYGGFAAALKDLKVWVMNVVPVDSPDTLPIIYERGLFGIYHDWCESFSTYPRSYDLLHAVHLFSDLRKRCNLVGVIAEVDRILRPGGTLVVGDDAETIRVVENMSKSLKWEILSAKDKDNEALLSVKKTVWRPTEVETIMSAVA
ncbi:hypothetical protein Nepgr_002739 [Nepenthes gracilis]|uniref:Methyltransferase PMT24 n=1 Tax=Nepenthes gracilis TaxID=150966 RepID=A0AAD3P484_NEPGR|nr:hypothetical protein Nepgr_002739 [Nepenthes gracilis]